jgi:hypothetical protein
MPTRNFNHGEEKTTISRESGSRTLKAIGLAFLTTALTLSGEYLLEGRKANLDVWRALQNIQLQLLQNKEQRQVEALYDIQSELKILEGEFVLISQGMVPLQPRNLASGTAEAGRTMSRIYPSLAVLDTGLQTTNTVRVFMDKLSLELAGIADKPTKANASNFLKYYNHEFESELAAALRSVQQDLDRIQSGKPST